ncbi:hypothetical protein MHU86_144 [Fragilaria crotonensis]|nr:hypothetical protein MHU86_144 [Fragilaria crotonensis]
MEREKEAFFWFYGTFLECVCGKRNLGRQKQHQRISEATDKGSQAKTVTISDEEFALLIFENYIDKWISTSADDMQDAGLVGKLTCRENREEGNSQGTGGSSQAKRVDTASMVGGVVRAWPGLMSYTNWFVRTERVHRLLQWKGSYWLFARQSMAV